MANALDGIVRGAGGILKGAGDFAGDVGQGVVDWAQRYTYGPYYKENQDIVKQQALARLESEKARKAHWESKGNTATGKGQLELSDINKTLETLQAMKLEAEVDGDPEEIEQLDNLYNMTMNAARSIIAPGKSQGTGTGKSPGPPLGGIDMTALGMNKVNPSVFNRQQPQGALGAIAGAPSIPTQSPSTAGSMGPPRPYESYFNKGPGLQPGEFAKPTPPQAMDDIATQAQQPADRALPKTAKTTNEIDFYMPKLDKVSQSELQQILSSGNQALISTALQMLRDQYGVVK